LTQYLPDRGQGLPEPRTGLHSTSSTVIVIHTIALATPSRTPAATLQYRPARAGRLLHRLQSLSSRRKHPEQRAPDPAAPGSTIILIIGTRQCVRAARARRARARSRTGDKQDFSGCHFFNSSRR